MTVQNTGASTINGWTVHLTLGSGQTITQLWSGVNTGSSGAVTVANASYNGTLNAGGSTSFGYLGSGYREYTNECELHQLVTLRTV